jgi:hypothetical protein
MTGRDSASLAVIAPFREITPARSLRKCDRGHIRVVAWALVTRPAADPGGAQEKKMMTKVPILARLATLALSTAIVVAIALPVLRTATLMVA